MAGYKRLGSTDEDYRSWRFQRTRTLLDAMAWLWVAIALAGLLGFDEYAYERYDDSATVVISAFLLVVRGVTASWQDQLRAQEVYERCFVSVVGLNLALLPVLCVQTSGAPASAAQPGSDWWSRKAALVVSWFSMLHGGLAVAATCVPMRPLGYLLFDGVLMMPTTLWVVYYQLFSAHPSAEARTTCAGPDACDRGMAPFDVPPHHRVTAR